MLTTAVNGISARLYVGGTPGSLEGIASLAFAPQLVCPLLTASQGLCRA